MGSKGVEKDKLKFINYTMNEIHDSLKVIYESFVDGEYQEVKSESSRIIKTLNSLKESVEDEI
tara:strand:- start:1237 stop:1425 length:189 start_codon:yes stop_codon:yes gene_type:complete